MANWIAGAVSKHKGVFRKKAERAGKSTSEFAKEHDGDSGTLGHEARLAETLIGMHHGPKKKHPAHAMYPSAKE